uniref:Uncharacterized protein n=1 Tax=Tanacetum cinerariifolium TaxID=118510 RepID=A0A699HAF5_TANCI|nr:hypothetical protein [Tanacetum cinerariifolium]
MSDLDPQNPNFGQVPPRGSDESIDSRRCSESFSEFQTDMEKELISEMLFRILVLVTLLVEVEKWPSLNENRSENDMDVSGVNVDGVRIVNEDSEMQENGNRKKSVSFVNVVQGLGVMGIIS